MAGTMIISLDCEGKWGMADHIGPEHHIITENNLNKAYIKLVNLLREYDIKATFAFVSAFILNENDRKNFEYFFQDVEYRGENWLRCYRDAQLSGNLDGWFCPQAFELAAANGHEIASHGFMHLPFDDPNSNLEDISRELEGVRAVSEAKGVSPTTFIFPRNTVGHLSYLRNNGFIGYRTRLNVAGRLQSLAREMNILEKSQVVSKVTDGLVPIPAGHFLNWRHGLRRFIPKSVTVSRWKSILNDAASTDSVAHLWLHPHNLISAPSTADTLQAVLAYAAKLRNAGLINIQTQHEYAVNCNANSAHA